MKLTWHIEDSLLDRLLLRGDEERSLERFREIFQEHAPEYNFSRLAIQSIDPSSRANCSDELNFAASLDSEDDVVDLLKQFAEIVLEKDDLYLYMPDLDDDSIDTIWLKVKGA